VRPSAAIPAAALTMLPSAMPMLKYRSGLRSPKRWENVEEPMSA